MNTPLGQQLQRFIPFDEWSEDIIEELIPHFRVYQLGARKLVFKRGEADKECHFLISGSIELIDEEFNATVLNADDDDNFMALDGTHHTHRYAAVTKEPCQMVSLQRSHLELISTWSELRQSMSDDDSEDSDWLERLITSELFTRVPPGNIQKLLSRFEQLPAAFGDVIVREGELGEHCYVIKTGKALVTRQGDTEVETLAALQYGDLFGEDALNSDLPRNAPVPMTASGSLMRLAKEDFDQLLRQPVLTYVKQSELDTLREEADAGVIVLDVRQAQEATSDPILRSRNIPLAQLRQRLKELEPDFIYAIYGGGRAEAAAYVLSEAGLNARVIKPDV